MTSTALPDEVRGDATVPGGTLADAPQRRRRRTAAQQTMSAVRYVLLVIFAVLVLTPAYALLVTSFKTPSVYDQTTAWKFPRVWSVGGWQAAWGALAPALGRSLVMAVLAAIISAILGSLNGYVFAKWKFPGSHVIFVLFLFGMFIPYQAIMIPLSGMMLDIQQGAPWFAGIPTLVLCHVVYGIPICTLIFRNYYATAVPSEIVEASRVDGAAMISTYTKIVLPVSIPGFVVTLIWQFTSAWNDFLFALFLFGMFIPYQAIMIPLSGMMLDIQQGAPWFAGIPTLVLCHVVYGIPICTLIFRNYYATAVPSEIVEASRVDGAAMISTYTKIVLPVSIPGFVVTLIWQFTSAWNDFLFALFLTNQNNGPVTFGLNALASGQNPNYPQIMAGVLIACLPTVVVYIALGKYFVSGLMSGSVK